jgi:hypothetical protein
MAGGQADQANQGNFRDKDRDAPTPQTHVGEPRAGNHEAQATDQFVVDLTSHAVPLPRIDAPARPSVLAAHHYVFLSLAGNAASH